MKIGIVWLPNVGKSTLFNALTKSYSADAQNFPFTTIEPNVGIVDVKDERLERLAHITWSEKIIYATTTFVDIAGLVKWASEWEWLGNKFLSHIREVDSIVQVLRYFKDDDIWHVDGSVDPLRDRETINTELILADLEQVERNIPALSKRARSGKNPQEAHALSALEKIQQALNAWQLVYDIRDSLTEDEHDAIKAYNFLTHKNFIYVLNVWQEDLWSAQDIIKQYSQALQAPVSVVCAALESEMMEFSETERDEYLEMLVEKQDLHQIPTLDDLISLAYRELGLMYYFTTGPKESRAWSIPIWSSAPQAAWAIHTDFEDWFIKAEVVSYDDLVASWGWNKAKELWKLRLQGKDYIVQDADVIVFKFSK